MITQLRKNKIHSDECSILAIPNCRTFSSTGTTAKTKRSIASPTLSAQIIRLNLHPSQITQYALYCFYLAVLTALILSDIGLALKGLLISATLIAGYGYERRRPTTIKRLEIYPNGEFHFIDQQNITHPIDQARFKYIFCYYVVMHTNHKHYRYLHVLSDMVNPSDFQKLRAYAVAQSLSKK